MYLNTQVNTAVLYWCKTVILSYFSILPRQNSALFTTGLNCCTVHFNIVLYCTSVLYCCTYLHSIVLISCSQYFTALYCTVLYCVLLYCFALCSTAVLYWLYCIDIWPMLIFLMFLHLIILLAELANGTWDQYGSSLQSLKTTEIPTNSTIIGTAKIIWKYLSIKIHWQFNTISHWLNQLIFVIGLISKLLSYYQF